MPPGLPENDDPSVYTSCFCVNSEVIAMSTAVGVCSEFCEAEAQSSIATWFRDLCSVEGDGGDGGGNNGGGNNGGNNGGGNNGGNGGVDGEVIPRPTTTGRVEYTNDGGDW